MFYQYWCGVTHLLYIIATEWHHDDIEEHEINEEINGDSGKTDFIVPKNGPNLMSFWFHKEFEQRGGALSQDDISVPNYRR